MNLKGTKTEKNLKKLLHGAVLICAMVIKAL